MDYLYVVNAFKQQQKQFLMHQQLLNQPPTTDTITIQQRLDNSNMPNSLIWQPWRDLQQVDVLQQLYQQHQKIHLSKETRITSKELPTSAWRRERRLRTGEYHHPLHHPSSVSSTSSARTSSPSLSPPPAAHVQSSPISSNSVSNAHQITIMMAAAAAASLRPLTDSTNCPSPTTHSTLPGPINLGPITHSQMSPHINTIENDDVPLDMSVSSLKHRNSPPPPYREPLPGSNFTSSLARPSVITQAPPKRDTRDTLLVANRENDNRSCESIDEHFRRSLGNDYFALFSKRSLANPSNKTPPPQPSNSQPKPAHVRSPSPTLPLPTVVSNSQSHSALVQSDLNPPPAYPANLQHNSHQQNSQQAHQNQILITSKANNALLSPANLTGQIKVTNAPSSPPLPLVVRPNVPPKNQLPTTGLHKPCSLIAMSPLTSPPSPASISGVKLVNPIQAPIFNTTGSRTASPQPLQQHPQSSTIALSFTQHTSVDNSPSSSPRHTPPILNAPVSNSPSNLPAIMRIKTEPGLQNVKSHNPTPPASPTSNTNHNLNLNSTSFTSNTSSPSSPITSSWKSSSSTGNTSAEVLASVDDHFAKALGDTWKKLQENKEKNCKN